MLWLIFALKDGKAIDSYTIDKQSWKLKEHYILL